MGTLLSYSLVSGLFMLVLYLAYRLFLARDNQHVFNRAILLLVYVVSFSMPYFIYLVDNMKMSSTRQVAIKNAEILDVTVSPNSQSIWWSIILIVFCFGVAFVFAKTIFTWLKLSNVIRHGEKIKNDGYTLIITDNEKYAPFSWIRYIVISRSDYESNCSVILSHELKHILSHHWVDLIISQIVCIINWFNPVAWLMRDEIMLVHEYQADMAVIDNGNDPQDYQILLIKKAVGSRFPSLANSLNHSKLKKRITMMYKSKSGAGRKLRALALVPMLVLALGVLSIPEVRAAVSTISSSTISADKGSENITAIQTEEVVKTPDIMPHYPGGDQAMIQAIAEEIRYGEAPKKEGASGKAVIKFTVTSNGEMKDFEVMKSSGYGDLDAEALRAVKEGLNQKWTPGSVDGHPVSVSYAIPITFALK